MLLTVLLLSAATASEAAAQEKTVAPEPAPLGPGVKETKEEPLEIRLGGYLQLWWTVKEETENGKLQPLTGDEAAQESSGFSFRRARLAVNLKRDVFRAKLELALEGSVRLSDAYGVWSAIEKKLEVWAGQMKIPSTYEVETPSTELDFAARSDFSRIVTDWSLCRGPTVSSTLHGIRTYLRDTGVGVKGEIGAGKYFLMVGNGLGSNLWIGGAENKQFVFANSVGAYFYGLRVSYDLAQVIGQDEKEPLFPSLTLGAHYNVNRHPNLIYRDEKTVVDLDRESWSLDLQVNIMNRLRLTCMVGRGLVLDDFDNDDKIDYVYDGLELKAVAVVIPGMLEVGLRYDTYSEEFYENDRVDEMECYTLGVTYSPGPGVKLQASYKWKSLNSDINPDIDDDVFLLAAQLEF
jgi:hypothetical protein